jgi:hypothetical protein
MKAERRYNSTLSLFLALNGGGWLTPRPGRFTPATENRDPLYRRVGGPPRPVWTDTENLVSTRIRSPGRPAHSESLYRMRHPDANIYNKVKIKYTFKISAPNLTGVFVILFLGKVGFVIRHNFSSGRRTFWNLLIYTFNREIRQLAARFTATQTDDHCFTYKRASMGKLKSRMKPIIHIHSRFRKIGQVA